ncbi:FG-GAP repeat domain-containing protein [Phytohabitans sp. LJ34]|uniref:FG-GAP repeat domain-containing protein n=1 Tax=Phytohabitans sp. LJ34 TaxID=3452217 RepID=UPI003F8A29FB
MLVLMAVLLSAVGVVVRPAPAAADDWYRDPCFNARQENTVLSWAETELEAAPDAVWRRYGNRDRATEQTYAVAWSTTRSASITVEGSLDLAKILELSGTYQSQISVQQSVTDTEVVRTVPGEFVTMKPYILYRFIKVITAWIKADGSGHCGLSASVARVPTSWGRCLVRDNVTLEEQCGAGVIRSGQGPGTGGTAPPTPPVPQPVTDVRHVADGTVLATTDTKRIYKMVGGAPVWQATCDNGICEPQSRPTTQAVINAGPATPRNGSSAIDQRGRVYIFVGGSPLWQDSCAAPVNCGTPVKVSDWSIDARDHMNRLPADGNLVQAVSNGTDLPVAATLGGALVPFANQQEVIETGHGTDWARKVTAISGNSYHALGLDPANGTLVQGVAGGVSTAVAAIAGKAVIPFASPQEVIDSGHGTNWASKVRAVPARFFHSRARVPTDNTLIQGAGGGVSTPVATMVGGARINFGSPQEVIDAGYGTDWPSKVQIIPIRAFNELRADVPADGTLIQGINGSTPVAKIVGGAVVPFANPQEVVDLGYGAEWALHVRAVPPRAYHALPTTPPTKTLVQGKSGDTLTAVAQVVGGARIPFSSGADATAVFGPEWSERVQRIPTRAYTAMPLTPADGTLMVNEGSVLYHALQGNVERAASCPESPACSSSLPMVLDKQLAGIREYGPAGLAWADVDGDGKADYCRRLGTVNHQDSKVSCTLSTGTGYGATVTSGVTDWGWLIGRQWTDVNGDKKADYCRIGGADNRANANAVCTPSTGTGFGPTFVSAKLDAGHSVGRAWADVNGDGRADYCRVRGTTNHTNAFVSCTPSTGTGFGADINSSSLDWGFPAGRAFTDFNGDGKADYCRVVGTANHTAAHVACTVSNGGDFGATYVSPATDWGFSSDRVWADVNGDKKSDYCRRVGSMAEPRMACTPSTGTGFGPTFVSGLADWGQPGSRTWNDVNGDGKADFCRVRGTANHTDSLVSCLLSTGTGFGAEVNSATTLDWGFHTGRGWADVNGDGRTDYCRRVGGSVNDTRVSCSASTGGGFASSVVSGVLEWGLAD